jgi:Integrase core domain
MNGAWRYEFYACSDLPLDIDKIAKRVDAFQRLYNHHRPHGAFAGMTPAKHLSIRRAEETQPVPYLRAGHWLACGPTR